MSSATCPWFAPPEIGRPASALIRASFALLVWHTVPGGMGLESQPHPVGIARLFDLTFLSDPGVLPAVKAALVPVLLLYVSGFWAPLATGLMLAATVLPGTLDNSQGSTQHSQQIISLILLAQFLYHLWAAAFPQRHPDRAQRERWSVFAAQQAIVAAYTVTALTKLLRSGIGWISDSANFPIQMVKNIRMEFYNTLQPEAVSGFWGSTSAFAQRLFLESPALCRVLLTCGLALELFAVLALLGRRWAALYGAALIAFHVLVRTMTGLNFRFHIAALFIFLVLPWLMSLRFRRPAGNTPAAA